MKKYLILNYFIVLGLMPCLCNRHIILNIMKIFIKFSATYTKNITIKLAFVSFTKVVPPKKNTNA